MVSSFSIPIGGLYVIFCYAVAVVIRIAKVILSLSITFIGLFL